MLERGDAEAVVLRLELPPPRLTGHPFAPVRWPGLALARAGSILRLPVAGALVAVPATGGVHVEVLEAHYRDFPLDRRTFSILAPDASPTPARAPVAGDPPGFLGPVRVMRVRFHPAQLRPREGVLRIYRRLRVALRFERPLDLPPDWEARLAGAGLHGDVGGMAGLARSVVLNLGPATAGSGGGARP